MNTRELRLGNYVRVGDKIVKVNGQPRLEIDETTVIDIASIGDDLVEYDNGEWDIVKTSHE